MEGKYELRRNLSGNQEKSQQMVMKRVYLLVTQLCLTLCDHMDCSSPGPSVLGIFWAGTLEWVAIPFSRGIFQTQGLNLGLPYC